MTVKNGKVARPWVIELKLAAILGDTWFLAGAYRDRDHAREAADLLRKRLANGTTYRVRIRDIREEGGFR